MIRVNYEKRDNYPHDKATILLDRSAFQSLSKEDIHKVNEKYNILCPPIFVIECIAPNNTDKKSEEELQRDKKALLEKLELIENPIVLVGSTNVTYRIVLPPDVEFEYSDILDAWRIAKNCIINSPVTMKRVCSKRLVSSCEPRVMFSKYERRKVTEIADDPDLSLTPNRYRSHVQRRYERLYGEIRPMSEIRRELRSDPSTHLTQELSNVAKHALMEIMAESKHEIIEGFRVHFGLNDKEIKKLHDQIQDNKNLTVENYPHLSYPIYIYYLIRYMLYGRQQKVDHLDSSFYLDFQYLKYLNFCDRFIVNETSIPYIVRALPYSNIRQTPIITARELKEKLLRSDNA